MRIPLSLSKTDRLILLRLWEKNGGLRPDIQIRFDEIVSKVYADLGMEFSIAQAKDHADKLKCQQLGTSMIRTSGGSNELEAIFFVLNQRGLRMGEAVFDKERSKPIFEHIRDANWTAIGAIAAGIAAVCSIIILFRPGP